MKRALVVAAHNALEHHVTLVYRTIFLGETLAVIEAQGGGRWSATAHDTLIDGLNLTDMMELLIEEPECVFICADVHQSRSALFLASVAKDVSPATQVFAYGRATTFIPHYFRREPFDAVHVSGDREVAIADYLRFLDGQSSAPSGVALLGMETAAPGRTSGPSEWAYPKLDALPITRYREYVRQTYGDHYTPRISATIGKGCSWGCEYCGATEEEGARDRRRDPADVVSWALDQPYLADGFSLHLYHPNLFADQNWIARFSDSCISAGSKFAWRGVTTTVTLRDAELVSQAGEAGCRELAIGVESISADAGTTVKSSLAAVERAAQNAKNAGISLKGLVMAGYPGQTTRDLEETRRLLTSLGLVVRFTGYTPLHKLRSLSPADLDKMVIERFDRRTYLDPDMDLSHREFFRTLVRDNSYAFPEDDE